MTDSATVDPVEQVWGPYPNYGDIARFEYGRLLWRSTQMRARLLRQWTDPRHPYRERFLKQRTLIEEVLHPEASSEALDLSLRTRNTSLRAVAREIAPVFGTCFECGTAKADLPQ